MPDACDICPGGDDNVDTDSDGVPDFCDTCPGGDDGEDADGDGVCDSADICPGGDDTIDSDGDGVPDFCDPCPVDDPDDTDGDGVCDSADPCPLDNPDDTDGDGVCDSADPCPLDNPDDTDGDGVCDSADPCPLDNPDDTDGDGVCDSVDACPGGDDNLDADGDGVADFCDPCPDDDPDDTDGDGVCESDDICPGGDDGADADGDGVPDFCDPCPLDNPDDTDGDGVCDVDDICPGGDDTIDTDGDGAPDFCDPCPLDDPDDTDGDGTCDSDDICPADPDDDADGDGLCVPDDACPNEHGGGNPNGCPDAGPKLRTGFVPDVDNQSGVLVDLGQDYDAKVVIAVPVIEQGMPPLVTRVDADAASDAFQLYVQRADGSSASVSADVYYLVVEEGDWFADYGFEARRTTSTTTQQNNSWGSTQSVGYLGSYASPVVLGQVMSINDSDWSAFWCRGSSRSRPPSSSTLRIGKMVGEDPDVTRANELVGWVVFEAGNGTIDGVDYYAAVSGDTVRGYDNSPPYDVPVSGLSQVDSAVVGLVAMDGGNGGYGSFYGPNPVTDAALETVVDEDQLGDSERNHTTEQVAYIAFDL